MFGPLRFPLKTAGFLGWTLGLYGLLEADTFLSARAEHEARVKTWQGRYGRGLLRIWGVDVDAQGPGLSATACYPGADARHIGRVFVMNHRSALDIFVALAFLEASMVSRADLAGWPVIGMAARRVGTLFVDRQSRQSGAAVIQAMTTALQRGRGVMVFPEGTTFAGDEIRPLHPGCFHAAVRAGAEVVPLGLCYERDDATFGDEEFSVHMKRIGAQARVRAALQAGAPIPAAGQTTDALREKVHAELQALVKQARARLA
jgi:1-acyl-sn-glycerol-3-phosphate acyltransferase